MYRGQAHAFATEAVAIGWRNTPWRKASTGSCRASQLAFLYMPLMHSEDLADQDRSVRLFEAAGLG